MTTTTRTRPARREAPMRITTVGVLQSEWIKLRSVRSTA